MDYENHVHHLSINSLSSVALGCYFERVLSHYLINITSPNSLCHLNLAINMNHKIGPFEKKKTVVSLFSSEEGPKMTLPKQQIVDPCTGKMSTKPEWKHVKFCVDFQSKKILLPYFRAKKAHETQN